MIAIPGRVSKLSVCLVLLALFSPAESATHDHAQQFKTERREVRIPVKDFKLIDQNGKPFELENLSRKVLVISFSYTSCADVCPLITAAARQVQSGLTASERANVHLLTITTDPEIDSPRILAAYAKRYGAEFSNWSFLTGPEVALKKVWKNFGVRVSRKGRGIVEHTPLTAVMDRQRQLRFVYIGPSPDPMVILADMRALLAER